MRESDVTSVSLADQKAQNDSAKQETEVLRGMVVRMTPVLSPLTSARGLDGAKMVLDNLGTCLKQARHIYSKYQTGWNKGKFWVTPGQILEKILRSKTQVLEAFQELTVALNIANHIREDTPPHSPFAESQKTWEIAFSEVKISKPKVALGHGAFGIVVLATFKGEEVTFLCTFRSYRIYSVVCTHAYVHTVFMRVCQGVFVCVCKAQLRVYTYHTC